MKFKEIEKLINECVEVSRKKGFDWIFDTDLDEVLEELKNIKSLLPVVMQRSEQLKDKEATKFESWLKNNCKSGGAGTWFYKANRHSYKEIISFYKKEINESL